MKRIWIRSFYYNVSPLYETVFKYKVERHILFCCFHVVNLNCLRGGKRNR